MNLFIIKLLSIHNFKYLPIMFRKIRTIIYRSVSAREETSKTDDSR